MEYEVDIDAEAEEGTDKPYNKSPAVAEDFGLPIVTQKCAKNGIKRLESYGLFESIIES